MTIYKSPWKFILLFFLFSSHLINSEPSAQSSDQKLSRHPRALGIFDKVATTWNLLYQQYNDTTYTLQNVLDLLTDSFSDTYTTTTPKVPTVEATTSDPTSTTTQRYRISRMELGKILNRNYRGLQKLFGIEWNDAWNQTKYSIRDYQRELKYGKYNRTTTATTTTTTTAKP